MAASSKASGSDGGFFSKTLTDIEKEVYVEDWSSSSDELGVGEGWSIEKRRLSGGLSDGVDAVEVNNGKLSFVVVPTRGMGIWKG
ncbi:MAG: aldose 1-epimerase family protein, partial [Candidatus Bathyarchaeota archaeon]|nr:aldose 1-epimerase family protein [Candidatus Bathyarchaeota archaeon]